MTRRLIHIANTGVRRLLLIAVCALGLFAAPALTQPAVACPMCQVANDNADKSVPRAYMYSILFMLAMPATVLAGFGIGFYRLSKKARADQLRDVDKS